MLPVDHTVFQLGVWLEPSNGIVLAGKYIRDSSLIRDPASALIIGMLITVVLQSSTTFTNVLVSMVAANSESFSKRTVSL